MAGLCNICDEVGTKNWNNLTDLIQSLSKEVSGVSMLDDTPEENEEDLEEEFSRTNVITVIDLTEEDDEYSPCNPLPVDSPMLMIETGIHASSFDHFLRFYYKTSNPHYLCFPLYDMIARQKTLL